MLKLRKFALLPFIALLSINLPAAPSTPRPDRYSFDFPNNFRVVNLVDDFLSFWDLAKGRTLRRQRRLWMRMVESKHRDYFERAVYRNADKDERRAMLNNFLLRVPEKIGAIREFNKLAVPLISAGVVDFIIRFPEYRQARDIYVGLSLFRFDASVRPVQNEEGVPDTLCLSAEMLADYSPEQVQVVLAHEFFHLYHFGFLFEHGSLAQFRTAHMPLMIEGMAIAGTEAVYPFQPASLYLHFSEEELDRQRDLLPDNCRAFLELIKDGAPPARYEQWFVNSIDTETPSRGGYLLGYEVTKRVLSMYTLEQMVRMSPAQLREHTEEQLAAIAVHQFILMAGSD